MLKANSPKPVQLPDFTLVMASAGSGKTTELTRRYLGLVMAEDMPSNDLRQVLAVTFTRNAAREMKERILETLKRAACGDADGLEELRTILAFDDATLSVLAVGQIDRILDHYSDFQIQTIDSFITRVLRAAAADLGLPPEFELEFNANAMLDEALDLLARDLASDPNQQGLFHELVDLIGEQGRGRYLWNPFNDIAKQLRLLHARLGAHVKEPSIAGSRAEIRELQQRILHRLVEIGDMARASGLELRATFATLLEEARSGDIASVFSKTITQEVYKKPARTVSVSSLQRIETMRAELATWRQEYTTLLARTRYLPYISAHRMLQQHFERVARNRGKVVLHDASRSLANLLTAHVIPEIYFVLGDRVHHYLIDEFQDTSPLQWAVLRPLIEESLSKAGSLFLVGDTKQSIYTFRGADWRIMGRMREREEFPSVPTRYRSLGTNYRSAEAIVEFAKEVFHTRVPAVVPRETSDLSGLVSYRQEVHDRQRGKGYVKVYQISSSDAHQADEERPVQPPEQTLLLEILRDCRARGYAFGDIAILTHQNTDVVEVSRWLNAAGIRFLSQSSLDIRTRKLTGEVLALLRFLDSPVDDLALATFLLGHIFLSSQQELDKEQVVSLILRERRQQARRIPLYRAVRDAFPNVWNRYFEHLMNVVGYLPLYDLVTDVYHAFRLFETHSDEEASLVKLLEVVKDFEESGTNSLKDFLAYALTEGGEESDAWEVATPEGEDAVRIMTVHKAKGLGFPIVIALLYDRVVAPDNKYVNAEGDEVELLHITKKYSETSPEIAEHYRTAAALAEVDDLNKLYVALTRAREEMHVLSVERGRDGRPSSILPSDGFVVGTPSRKPTGETSRVRAAVLAHHSARGFEQAKGDIPPFNETHRGKLIHNVLSEIKILSPDFETMLMRSLEQWQRTMSSPIDVTRTGKLLTDFLSQPSVRPYFTAMPGRTILNEQEVVGRDGHLYRVDRLVIDPDSIGVLDFKTGEEHDEHVDQVRLYMHLAGDLYPEKRVYGLLLYVDRMTVREVT